MFSKLHPHTLRKMTHTCVKLVMLQDLHGHGSWRVLNTSASRHRGRAARLQKVLPGNMHILPLLVDLVGLRHVLIEDLQGQGDQGGVSHPGAVMPVLHLPQLVCLHLKRRQQLAVSDSDTAKSVGQRHPHCMFSQTHESWRDSTAADKGGTAKERSCHRTAFGG